MKLLKSYLSFFIGSALFMIIYASNGAPSWAAIMCGVATNYIYDRSVRA